MRADDINDIIIMTRPIDGGGIRVTAQDDGVDIGHVIYFPWRDRNRPGIAWLSQRYRGRGIGERMHAALRHAGHHVDSNPQLDEVSIGQLAKAAAVGAGVLGSAYLGKGMSPPPKVPMPAVTQPAEPQDIQRMTSREEDPMAKAAAAASVSQPLAKAAPVDTETKVANFLDSMVPLVKAENARLSRDRQATIRMVSKIHRGKGLSEAETAWLEGMMDRYGTKDPMELIKKVDIIPNSMAIAQAAVESGWGGDELARKGNVIYGQKTWSKDRGIQGPAGERYATFDSPADSVRAYMQNLNTHPAYEAFRDARAKLRAKNMPVTGQALLPTMTKYSTLGKDYVSKVNKVIKGRNLHKLDR